MSTPTDDAPTVPLSAAVDAIVKNLGFPEARVRTVSRALQERGLFPMGGPRQSPMAKLEEVVTLIVGIAIDKPLHETADRIKAFDGLRPEGMPPEDQLPPQLDRMNHSPLDMLDVIAEELAGGDNSGRRLMIDVVAEPWPELTIRYPAGTVARYLSQGAPRGHWQARGYRKALTLNGAALGDVMLDLFGTEKADAA